MMVKVLIVVWLYKLIFFFGVKYLRWKLVIFEFEIKVVFVNFSFLVMVIFWVFVKGCVIKIMFVLLLFLWFLLNVLVIYVVIFIGMFIF